MPSGVYLRIKDNSGMFKKGFVPWNKGKTMSEETRLKLSQSKKINPTNYWEGRSLSEEHKEKISKSMEGKLKDRKVSEETKKRMSIARKGKGSYFWKGGITPLNLLIRNSLEYKLWRKSVFDRDNYTCKNCGIRGGILNAHHILSFSEFPEERFIIDNGITFCEDCHKELDGRK